LQANRAAGHDVAEYDQRPPDQQQEPPWPDLTLRDWLELAFPGLSADSGRQLRSGHLAERQEKSSVVSAAAGSIQEERPTPAA